MNMATPRILGLVNARGGSKGIPQKNINLLNGKPLIAYAIEAGLGSNLITHLVVSTDDDEIMETAHAYGAQVPFKRPARLATDDASQMDVVIHALNQMETVGGQPYDIVIILQPTAPLRTSEDVDAALSILINQDADSVVSFSPVTQHPYYMYTIEDGAAEPFVKLEDQMMQRQDFPAIYYRNGAIYATRRDVLVNQRSYYGKRCHAYIMPPERSVNIDTPFDWAFAEFLLSQPGNV
jgi:CMP-N,N'-diacetyllegionaminic acid synthase